MPTLSATAGRLAGTAYAHTRRTVALIDWQEVGQVVLHGLATLAVMTYLAGEFTGRPLHQLNDRLAAAWRLLLVPATAAPAPAAEPAPAPAAPITATLAAAAAPAARRERRRTHSPGLARWASSPDSEPPLRWTV